ncbi:MAG TPA: glycerophosphodiester phosphodiesterase family protein [Candidatus Paceibacterota bacterium]|nr:glycerophosphodiester phosphodiesterase family protein [Verrucomicrobiota bacterium]HSA13001.1 glycerophosphodiester phosphodiesterase family protein [Candidatus Paceibacterota bacterium]
MKILLSPQSLLESVCAISLVLGTLNLYASEPVMPALNLLASQRPLVIAHRGYSDFAPENTLPAFKLAVGAGADLVELDYHCTEDGKLVVIHDHVLDRTTDATNRWSQRKIKVETKTAAEIQSLDAGSWFDAKYAGTRILMLAEALDVIQAGGVTLVERKTGAPADCIKLLREKDLINRVIVQSFDWEYLRGFHDQEPAQVLGALGPPERFADGKKPAGVAKELSVIWLDELGKTGAKVVVWNRQVSKEAVRAAHRRGLKVWVYTINELELANDLLDMGVDGLITNNTSLMWKALALRAS